VPDKPARIQVDLLDGKRTLATTTQPIQIERTGETEVNLVLSKLGNVALWDVATPRLYEIKATLLLGDAPLHDYRVRLGFREARFEVDGFFLNGRRLQIFGLDRHELYPYVGSAMPGRVIRRDAEILKREFNCNMVRCSHYPQSEAFLDACDELGLMVWEELPGWQYIGDQAWQDLVVRDVQDMIRRDRNHPAIVIWGVRINESENNVPLYTRTTEAAKALDDSRQTSGAMNRYSTKDWQEDVYAYDDYHAAPDGSVGVRDPLPGVPYFLTEGVGQFAYGAPKSGFGRKYRRAADLDTQQRQALAHAQIHSKAAANPKIGGVIAWCAFDYGSPINSFQGIKCPGIADIFRVPKLGAAFYRAQADPKERVVIEPNFYWDFGSQSPSGPGERAAIFSNCERLEVFIDGQHHSSLKPDAANFPNLKHPPFFADLKLDGPTNPELRIDGYVGDKKLLSRSFSSDSSKDQLLIEVDDKQLIANGSDATRVVFRAVDKFGAPRPFVGGEVTLKVEGPAILVGDNPFSLADNGGAGAVWIRTAPEKTGLVRVTATHSTLGPKSVQITVRKPT
jgi:beta-galactosidase